MQQASAVAFRRRDDQFEFCLITSISSGRWGFPKGIVDPGETPEETALKEALEEAGLHGTIVGPTVGFYRYEKWNMTLEVEVLLMEVSGEDDAWEEAHLRQRCWVASDEVLRLLDRARLRRIFERALAILAED
jgi:phosphohistidine phosphatase